MVVPRRCSGAGSMPDPVRHHQFGGRPPSPPMPAAGPLPHLAITPSRTLRAVFRLALRQTEGPIGSILRLLGLDLPVPDHSTLSRRAETLAVPRPASGPGAEPVHLLVDGTGLKLCGPGEWLAEKHGSRTRRGWRKLHLARSEEHTSELQSRQYLVCRL